MRRKLYIRELDSIIKIHQEAIKMTGQQFNLRWNNHTNNLVQVFADQYEREQMVDVTLTCGGRFLKAHRMVLGACSPYFQVCQ